MAAPRASQFLPLRQIKPTTGMRQYRNLHITGAAYTPSRFLNADNATNSIPDDVANLRAECKKRNLSINGTKAELTDRLAYHALAVASGRPTIIEFSGRATPSSHFREVNTTRALKAPKDNSTMDFTFLPSAAAIEASVMPDDYAFSVPRLPVNLFATGEKLNMQPELITAHRSIISTVADSSTHISTPSAMSEIHDNTSTSIDFHAVADMLNTAAQKVEAKVEKEVEAAGGVMKQVWKGLLDDVFGPKAKPVA